MIWLTEQDSLRMIHSREDFLVWFKEVMVQRNYPDLELAYTVGKKFGPGSDDLLVNVRINMAVCKKIIYDFFVESDIVGDFLVIPEVGNGAVNILVDLFARTLHAVTMCSSSCGVAFQYLGLLTEEIDPDLNEYVDSRAGMVPSGFMPVDGIPKFPNTDNMILRNYLILI